MDQAVLTGMVLSTSPIGEYDRRIVILTREQGKIAAFARGARRPSSPLSGALNPFSFGEFTIHTGRSAYTVQAAKITNYFSELRGDMVKACYGFYFLEMADYYAKEGNDESELLKLLYQTLRALTSGKIPERLVRRIFELKILCINGEGPEVFECVRCKSRERPVAFHVKEGGLLCEACKTGGEKEICLDHSTLYAMQYIVSSKVERLYTFTVSEKVLKELEDVLESYMDYYIEKEFHSLEILRSLL